MTLCILDCSVAMSWCFEDEATPEGDQLLAQIGKEGAWVPNLWHLEVSNVLLQATKRKRITISQRSAILDLLSQLPIETDQRTHRRAFREGLMLAEQYGLSLYDASYLELALRKALPLASHDRSLIDAAERAGVSRV